MPGMEQIAGVALQQTLSPQMRQSLEILQAPLMDLHQMVRRELELNPVLEEEPPERSEDVINEGTDDPQASAPDDQWSEYQVQSRGDHAATNEWRQRQLDQLVERPTLQSFLLGQLAEAGLENQQRKIGEILIGPIDKRGYFHGSIEEIAWLNKVDEKDVKEVLAQIRQFDPPGVGAENLGECLALQLERRGGDNRVALAIVRDHLDLLARKKLTEIARRLNVDIRQVREAAARITALDPRPGRQFASEPEIVVGADVLVEKGPHGWEVRLNEENLPRIRLGNFYKDLLGDVRNGKETRDYVRERIRDGKFFIRCLEQRQQTILKIAREIVQRQTEFLESGPSALRPMTMSQIAEAIGIHETTVSRAVANKYMSTPHGLLEMRSFFTAGVATDEGIVSNKTVKDAVEELVASEDGKAPLSDRQILEALEKRGIRLARRTVAKYREQLGILPKHLRRRL